MINDEITPEEFSKLPTKTDEERVRAILEKELKRELPKKRVKLGNITHEFDLFAKDGSIIGEVKSGKDFLYKNKKIKNYRFAELCLDCLYLMSMKADEKIFVLTNKDMFDAFKKTIHGLAIEGIKIRLIELKSSIFR